jgi:excisionase family DNA binding protein
MTEQPGECLTIAEAMPLLNLSDRTIRKRIAQGTIPAEKDSQEHGGAQWKIPRSWLGEYSEEYSKRKTETESRTSETEHETEAERTSTPLPFIGCRATWRAIWST